MWPFKRRKQGPTAAGSGPSCPNCGSQNTRTISLDVTGTTGHIKTWRGQRFATSRCSDCGRSFYAQEQAEDKDAADPAIVENPDELRAAEEELKRQTEAEGDRRYRPDGL